MKGRKLQIPLKQINKHHISFEANDKDHSVDEKRGHRKGDESYREKNNNNYLKNLDQMYQNDKRENKKEILKQNETEEGSDTGRGLKRKEIKTEDMINKLEEMNQKKTSLEHLIKERSNNFISKWGKKAFDELSSFFRTRIGVRV